MSFQEAVAYASTPQAEGRIGSEDKNTKLYHEIMKENKDRRPGDDWAPSVFLNGVAI
jgi:hypothetical protein